MQYYYKIQWACRALVFSLIFGRFGLPSYIGKPIFLLGARKAFFGGRVRIFPGMRMEVHGDGKLVVEDDVSIGQNFHVTCAGELVIRTGTLISGDVMITDIDHEYRDVDAPVSRQPFLISRTEIGENCFIGLGVRIQAGTLLGKGCVVGTNAVVRGVFPPHSVIVGAPGRIVKRYDPSSKMWERC